MIAKFEHSARQNRYFTTAILTVRQCSIFKILFRICGISRALIFVGKPRISRPHRDQDDSKSTHLYLSSIMAGMALSIIW